MKDPAYLQAHRENLLKTYRERRHASDKEFDDARRGNDVERTVEHTSEPVDDVPLRTDRSRSHMLKGGNQLAAQDLAVVVIVPDKVTGEFCFQVLGCFSKKEEADRWICNVASRKIVAFDIHVVATYQWIFPNRIDGDGAQDINTAHPNFKDHGSPACCTRRGQAV